MEKVWIAEQKHDAEEKKLAELRKNIEEERQLQELRQLQAANGNKSAALERVDWLYEGPMAAQSGNTTEEYLLGKEYKPDAAASDLKQLGTSKYGSLAPTKSALPANDAFSRLNEDPMMLIRYVYYCYLSCMYYYCCRSLICMMLYYVYTIASASKPRTRAC